MLDRQETDTTQWVRWLQEQHTEMLHLLHLQQREIEDLKVKGVPKEQANNHNNGQQGGSNSLEGQLQDLVGELRKLQEQSRPRYQGEEPENSITNAVFLLQELKEERKYVADMLENVKKEKCEVIALMHTFAMDKAAALEDLDHVGRSVRNDILAMLSKLQEAHPGQEEVIYAAHDLSQHQQQHQQQQQQQQPQGRQQQQQQQQQRGGWQKGKAGAPVGAPQNNYGNGGKANNSNNNSNNNNNNSSNSNN